MGANYYHDNEHQPQPVTGGDEERRGQGMLMLANFISNALDERRAGESPNYTFILQSLSGETSAVVLKRWLRALTQCVSQITRENFEVVDAVLAMPWTLRDAVFANVYMDFVENLLSANAYYTAPAIHMLVLNMTYRPEIHNAPRQPSTLSETELADMYNRVHQALFSVLSIVPTAVSLLIPILNDFFPHQRMSIAEHVWFMRNLMRVLEVIPELMPDAFGIIIDRMIQIDVEIQVDLEELNEDMEGEPVEDDGQSADENTAVADAGNDMDEDSDIADTELRRKNVRQLVQKLDQMLSISMEFLERCFEQLERPHQRTLLDMLLNHFQRTVMTTHRSRYTQFLLFYASSKRTEFTDYFLSYLISILMDAQKSMVVRQAAVAYIAGLVCRSRRVTIETTVRCFDIMFDWARSYIDHVEEGVVTPDAGRFGLFYSVCQALFYMLCFRHRQLLSMRDGAEYLRGLGFERLINSRFNPLRVCMSAVVEEFAKITAHYEIVYCWTIINSNRRMLQTAGADGHGAAGHGTMTDMDSFFVFEPFRLRLSARYIEAHYQEWEGEATYDDSGSDARDDDDEGGDDDDDDDDGTGSDASYTFDMTLPDRLDSFDTMRALGILGSTR